MIQLTFDWYSFSHKLLSPTLVRSNYILKSFILKSNPDLTYTFTKRAKIHFFFIYYILVHVWLNRYCLRINSTSLTWHSCRCRSLSVFIKTTILQINLSWNKRNKQTNTQTYTFIFLPFALGYNFPSTTFEVGYWSWKKAYVWLRVGNITVPNLIQMGLAVWS